MGNSRVMFIAAVSVVLGMYTLGIQKADSRVQSIPLTHAYKMQAKAIAKSGVGMAVQKLLKRTNWIENVTNVEIHGGNLNYTAVNFSEFGQGWAYVYVTGSYKNQSVNAYAWVRQVNAYKWAIKSIVTQDGANNGDFADLARFSN